MNLLHNPQFGDKMVTLMAALGPGAPDRHGRQRWLVTNIRLFAAQSFLLGAIAGTIAWYNHAPHIYIAAGDDACWSKGFWCRFCWSAWWTASRSTRRLSRS